MTPTLDDLLAAVMAAPKYRDLHPGLVRRLATAELERGRSLKEAVKAVRGKLHQVGGAYQEGGIDYRQARAELAQLGTDPADPQVQAFCRRWLGRHASTAERLPEIERFFHETLAVVGPINSILDVACGLNPLALPWLPLAAGACYRGCDIYLDMLAFLQEFYAHLGWPAEFAPIDLTSELPQGEVQLALVLKTIPCLEQVDKSIGQRLLEGLPAEWLLVSFPARSLGGRSKGMPQTYEAHFNELIAGRPWRVQRFAFRSELAFLVHKG